MKLSGLDYDIISERDFLDWAHQQLNSETLAHVVTLNPEMVVEARKNTTFAKAAKSAELVVADGSGLLWADRFLRSSEGLIRSVLRFLVSTEHQPLPGVAIALQLTDLCNQYGMPVFLLGASSESNEKAQAFLRRRYPNLSVSGLGGEELDRSLRDEIVNLIRASEPAVLLVALGSPRQTIWIEQHRKELSGVRIAVGVGGTLDFWSGKRTRAPRWLRSYHLEWLWRWMLEPSRWHRVWRATVAFTRIVLNEKRAGQISK